MPAEFNTIVNHYHLMFLYIGIPVFMLGLIIRMLIAKHDGKGLIEAWMMIVFVALLIGLYPQIQNMLMHTMKLALASTNDALEEFCKNIKDAKVEGSDSRFNISAHMTVWIYTIIWGIGFAIKLVMQFVQLGLLTLMKIVSPLVLAFMAIPNTKNVGEKFLLTTFGIAAWTLALNIADVFMLGILAYLFKNMNDPVTLGTSVNGVGATVAAAALAPKLILMLGSMFLLSSLVMYIGLPWATYAFISGQSVQGAFNTAFNAAGAIASQGGKAALGALKAGASGGAVMSSAVKGAMAGAKASQNMGKGASGQMASAAKIGASNGMKEYANQVMDNWKGGK